MMLKKITILLLWLPYICLSQKTYRQENIGFKDGLPSDFVSCTAKIEGKLYIATQRGLCLYDGYQFVKTNYITTQTTHLVEKNSNLYFYFHGNGVGSIKNIFDKPTRIANVNYSDHNTNNDHYDNIYVDNENRIWCSDQNNVKYFIKNSTFNESFTIDANNKDVRFFASFLEPKNKESIWIATHKGLFVWDKKSKKLSKHSNKNLQNHSYVSASLVSKDKILFTTNENRILLYTISTNTIQIFDDFKTLDGPINIKKNNQNSIFIYNKRQIHTLDLFSLKHHLIFNTKNKINDVYNDKETKIIWVSTNKGLVKLTENDGAITTLHPPKEFSNPIFSIVQDEEETIWMTFKSNEIYGYTKSGVWKKFTYNGEKCLFGNLSIIKKTIIISSNSGVFKIENNQLTKILNTTYDVRKSIIDSNNNLWTIEEKGKIRVYKNGIENVHFIKNNSDFWNTNTFNDITEDKTGRIWIASWMPKDYGIAFFDKKNQMFFEISKLKYYENKRYIVTDYYNRIGFTKNNNIIFSGHGGFNTCTKNGVIIHALNTLDYKIANDQIEGITGDSEGNIWFGCAEGLYVYSFKLNKAIRFSQIDGLETNDITNGFCLLKNDQIAVGTDSKIQIIDLKKILISKIYNGLELIVIEKDGEFLPNTKNVIELNYNFTELDLHFSSLSYLEKEKVVYRYKFEGDDKWNYLGSNPKLPLVKLPPGQYKLIVEVGDNLNNWQKKSLKIDIHINPPFYRTIWFYILIGLFVTLIGFLINRYLIIHEKREGELKRKIKDVEMQILRSQMNPHFLFNSLNSINSFIIQQKTSEASGYLTTFSKLMRNILDNSRYSSISLSKEIETLELYLELESVRLDHKFDYEIIYDENLDLFGIMFPPLILQPFVENSIWHGLHNKKGTGKLQLIFEDKDESILVRIIDDGIGRTASALLKQKEVKHKSYGIDITIDRLIMLNAKNKFEIIDLYDENNLSRGTEVQLEIFYYD